MIDIRQARKIYRVGELEHIVLKDISLSVEEGEYVAIVGPSGAGKTTLLNIIGCLDTLDAGEYRFAGQPIDVTGPDDLSELRRRNIGFVFQLFNLISNVNAWRNVELPLIYEGVPRRERQQRAVEMLAAVDLADFAHHMPTQLSGGQQQRVAIARALINKPKLLVLDEPTGNLDSATGKNIMTFFSRLHRGGTGIVMVTHDAEIANYAQRIVEVRDGRLVSDQSKTHHGSRLTH